MINTTASCKGCPTLAQEYSQRFIQSKHFPNQSNKTAQLQPEPGGRLMMVTLPPPPQVFWVLCLPTVMQKYVQSEPLSSSFSLGWFPFFYNTHKSITTFLNVQHNTLTINNWPIMLISANRYVLELREKQ